jgi:DNA-binding PadR family transcriptional regulator
MAKELSDRETAVLRLIEKHTIGPRYGIATGPALASDLNRDPSHIWDASPAGVHRTAASLVRKGLVRRAGTSKLRWYNVNEAGSKALAGHQDGEWVGRDGY